MEEPKNPTFEEVMESPHKGDLLCFDGVAWIVARRDGVHFEVRGREPGQAGNQVKPRVT